METKTCTKCLETLPIEQFKYLARKQRHATWCDACTKEYFKQHYRKHRSNRQDKRYMIGDKVQCNECKRILPATTEYFWAKKSGLARLSATCKDCYSTRRRANYTKKKKLIDGKKQCTKCKQWLPATDDYFSKNTMGWLGLQPHCKECAKKQNKEWAQTPTGKQSRQISRSNYYSRKRQAPGNISKQEIEQLFTEQKGQCFYCHKELENNKFHLDHFIPLTKGGTNTIDNIRISCPRCNLRKQNKLPNEWSFYNE